MGSVVFRATDSSSFQFQNEGFCCYSFFFGCCRIRHQDCVCPWICSPDNLWTGASLCLCSTGGCPSSTSELCLCSASLCCSPSSSFYPCAISCRCSSACLWQPIRLRRPGVPNC